MSVLPVIDIAALAGGTGDAPAVGQAIDRACRDVGFFYVVGHGIDPGLRARLEDCSRRFFALADDEKGEIAMPLGGRAWRGWFPVGGELTSGVPDRKEGIYFGAEVGPDDPLVRAGRPMHGANLFPRRPVELRDTVLVYLEQMTTLGQAILSGLALGLGLERSWFAEHLTADPLILFRIFHYPPAPDAWGVGEHTDYGLLTILSQDRNGGLQVRTPQGWVDAPPVPDSFVCNLGDMLERLTGGRYRSTAHRVRNVSGADRVSFPFFLDPSWDAVVHPLPIVNRPADDDAAGRWDRMSVHGFAGTYGDYILAKVAKVFPQLLADTWRPDAGAQPSVSTTPSRRCTSAPEQ